MLAQLTGLFRFWIALTALTMLSIQFKIGAQTIKMIDSLADLTR